MSTANNGTSAGVLALVRTRWFSKFLSICTDEAGVLCTNPRLVLLLTADFEHSVGFRSDINANLMHDVCFLTRDGKPPIHLGSGFQLPAQFVAGLVFSWRQSLDPQVGSIGCRSRGFHTHVPYRQGSKT